ncbi:MAG: type II toxin-antitoxin system VapC family toxin [Thermoguttaceae bacterium]|jgi:predicted nucleic acid-binding protein
MSRFILDCSIAMNWCFEDESQLIADHVLDRLLVDQALVPAVWLLEVGNVLLVGERRGRLTSAQASHFLAMLERLPILIDSPTSLKTMGDIYSLARTYQLSAYDAAYLELAMREGVILATLDESLSAAAAQAGVSVFKINT